MRALTIKRTKAMASCLVKVKLYIEDNENPEITIRGYNCRKVGEIKNNAETVVEIDEAQHTIFAVTDIIFKDSASMIHIPAGDKDVMISGKCSLTLLQGNPFVFDQSITYAKSKAKTTNTQKTVSKPKKEKLKKKDPYNGKIRTEYIQYTTSTIAIVSYVSFVCGICYLLLAIFYGNIEMYARILMYVLGVFTLLSGCVYVFLAPILIRRYPKYKKITCALLQEYLFKECNNDLQKKKFKK